MTIAIREVRNPRHDNCANFSTLPVRTVKLIFVEILGRRVYSRTGRDKIDPELRVITPVRRIVWHSDALKKHFTNDGCVREVSPHFLPLRLQYLNFYTIREVF